MESIKDQPAVRQIGTKLLENKWFKVGEIALVFTSALLLIKVFSPLVEDDLILQQLMIWFANILMLLIIWLGLKLRGQDPSDFGITFKSVTLKDGVKVFLLSLLVFALAMIGFIIGSIIMANIMGIPESADMSAYAYLKDNMGMFILTLGGIYLVSSFGEEVIYRAFLINRFLELAGNSKKGKIISIVFSSIVFGLVHYQWGPMGIVQTGFMGLALGFSYLKFKKRIWILVLAHAYMDTILMIQVYLASN